MIDLNFKKYRAAILTGGVVAISLMAWLMNSSGGGAVDKGDLRVLDSGETVERDDKSALADRDLENLTALWELDRAPGSAFKARVLLKKLQGNLSGREAIITALHRELRDGSVAERSLAIFLLFELDADRASIEQILVTDSSPWVQGEYIVGLLRRNSGVELNAWLNTVSLVEGGESFVHLSNPHQVSAMSDAHPALAAFGIYRGSGIAFSHLLAGIPKSVESAAQFFGDSGNEFHAKESLLSALADYPTPAAAALAKIAFMDIRSSDNLRWRALQVYAATGESQEVQAVLEKAAMDSSDSLAEDYLEVLDALPAFRSKRQAEIASMVSLFVEDHDSFSHAHAARLRSLLTASSGKVTKDLLNQVMPVFQQRMTSSSNFAAQIYFAELYHRLNSL